MAQAGPPPSHGGPRSDYSTVFTNSKAGMEGLSEADKARIKQVVFDMSKGSAHFENEQRKQAQLDEKLRVLKQRAAHVATSELAQHQRALNQKLAQLEATRDLSRVWVHVDMDAFYAAVEELDNPDLKTVPMAVGGIGMISTANYPARKFGVRSAMPGFIAKVLCPQLVFVPCNFERYVSISEQTRAVFRDFDAAFEAGSLDEAFLDVTEYCREHGMSGAQVAEQLRRRAREETKLTCSCGVAPNKMLAKICFDLHKPVCPLAKICSDLHKPDGQYVLGSTREDVTAFVATLPVRKVPGIGRVNEQTLAALSVTLCGHILPAGALLSAVTTPGLLDSVLSAGMGLGATRHAPPAATGAEPGRKGLSCERTDMVSGGIEGRTITLKLKASL
ncbi:hypothetical protein FOA52_008036 [Chlamydomonas sp. UWO 241]|nr:hypothetical protein FOA52_008036 [Chlamydomonas sp. UWO 241]